MRDVPNTRAVLPKPASDQMSEVVKALYNVLTRHPGSWHQTKDFYLHNPTVTGAGRDLGIIMENLELLAHGVDESEWLMIGVDPR